MNTQKLFGKALSKQCAGWLLGVMLSSLAAPALPAFAQTETAPETMEVFVPNGSLLPPAGDQKVLLPGADEAPAGDLLSTTEVFGVPDASVAQAPLPGADDPIAPSFDVVRVDGDGAGVIVGRAEPGATVNILSNGVSIATAVATSKGEFVAFVTTPPTDSEAALALSLTTRSSTGVETFSKDTVLILPVIGQTEAEAPIAPTIVKAEEDTLRVIQPAGLVNVDGVLLDSISYDDEGEVVLAGRGRAGRMLQIYADDSPLESTTVSDGGTWLVELHGLSVGRYLLRIDEFSEDGTTVTSRAESPFQRMYPEAAAEAMKHATAVTVQPGNSLWVLARERYGQGIMYTQIFAANKDQIRDPDLIYPGQIFALPEAQ